MRTLGWVATVAFAVCLGELARLAGSGTEAWVLVVVICLCYFARAVVGVGRAYD